LAVRQRTDPVNEVPDVSWLSEVLDDKERARLEEFMRASDPR
jgi:hypothetical protein